MHEWLGMVKIETPENFCMLCVAGLIEEIGVCVGVFACGTQNIGGGGGYKIKIEKPLSSKASKVNRECQGLL